MQMTTDEEYECKKAVDKLTKKIIFKISATVNFLAGMVYCYTELEKEKASLKQAGGKIRDT